MKLNHIPTPPLGLLSVSWYEFIATVGLALGLVLLIIVTIHFLAMRASRQEKCPRFRRMWERIGLKKRPSLIPEPVSGNYCRPYVPVTGVDLIATERLRQISEEGWLPDHDDGHFKGELAEAAACYAYVKKAPFRTDRTNGDGRLVAVPFRWPWDGSWWKPCPDDRVRELTKAGALIAAEIDRLLRKKNREDAEAKVADAASLAPLTPEA